MSLELQPFRSVSKEDEVLQKRRYLLPTGLAIWELYIGYKPQIGFDKSSDIRRGDLKGSVDLNIAKNYYSYIHLDIQLCAVY